MPYRETAFAKRERCADRGFLLKPAAHKGDSKVRRIGLKYKLLLGPMVMVCLVMVVSLIVVVTVLKRQNRSASYDQIQKAVHNVEEELQARQARLLEAARQVSGAYDLGARVKESGGRRCTDCEDEGWAHASGTQGGARSGSGHGRGAGGHAAKRR